MLKKLVNPSRWGGGISLLWRGNTFKDYLYALNKSTVINQNFHSLYPFDSARNALFHFMKSIGIKKGDVVQVMYYTCDAVTDVLLDLECDIKFYDCDSNFKSIDFELDKNCKLLISQITFGREAHSEMELQKIAKKGVKIVIDKSLSYGPKDFSKDAQFNFPTLVSFEVSKSITFGWAGLLILPNPHMFLSYYNSLKKVGWLRDIYRNITSLLNLYFIQNGSTFKFFGWALLKVLMFHRASYKSSSSYSRNHSKLGFFSLRVFYGFFDSIQAKLEISNKNHNYIANLLKSYSIKINSEVDEVMSSPRVHFSLPNNTRLEFIHFMKENKIEIGYWFDRPPINLEKNLVNANSLFLESVNLSCHWSLKDHEIEHIKRCINNFFEK
jgi:dTDP-4-amino-4,6-dideoxygalactose transaminase